MAATLARHVRLGGCGCGRMGRLRLDHRGVAADRAAINNSLGSTLATASFGVGDTKPAIYYPQQGKAYWGVIRGEIVTGRKSMHAASR